MIIDKEFLPANIWICTLLADWKCVYTRLATLSTSTDIEKHHKCNKPVCFLKSISTVYIFYLWSTKTLAWKINLALIYASKMLRAWFWRSVWLIITKQNQKIKKFCRSFETWNKLRLGAQSFTLLNTLRVPTHTVDIYR